MATVKRGAGLVAVIALTAFISMCCSRNNMRQIAGSISADLVVDMANQRTVMLVAPMLTNRSVNRDDCKPDDLESYCGGVFVSETSILTAYHCVDDPTLLCMEPRTSRITICGYHGATEPTFFFITHDQWQNSCVATAQPQVAVMVKHSADDDLALLATISVSPYHARVPEGHPKRDEKVHLIGHPGHNNYSHFTARVGSHFESKIDNVASSTPTMHIRLHVDKGMSGNGAWNNRGELVGICRSSVEGKAASYYASTDSIRTFLAKP